jgi:protein phosphatase 2C family protein 2/3
MNNDLLNLSNQKKTHNISNIKEINSYSSEGNNFDTYKKKRPYTNMQKKRDFSNNKNSKNKNKNYLNDYYNHEENKNLNKAQNMITLGDIFAEDNRRDINLDILDVPFDNFFPGKVSRKSYGPVKSYAANTNQGITRNYNEDRVSIIININKNLSSKCKEKKIWPKASYFSIFDGHGGNKCADFLKNNLLILICENKFYPNDIENAIKFGFNEADKIFLKLIQKNGEVIDNSGSCGLILLVFETKIYIANVGDSRCIISLNNGQTRKDVTRDHKPNYPYEKERIIANGGKIYQTQTYLNQNGESNELADNDDVSNIEKNNTELIIIGPYRVAPGNLSVSRTIGDPVAKLLSYGGNSKVVISEPDIYCFDLEKDDIDFLILGCDGIYDQLTSQEILESAWKMIEKNKKKNIDIYNTCANIVDFILKMSMARKSFDNVTCLMVAFKDLMNDNQKEEKKTSNDNVSDKSEDKLPNIMGEKAFSLVENNESNKNKLHIDKNKKMLNIKSLKISKDQESRNRNKLNSEELSHIIKNNNILTKESKTQENDENDFLKYKHKLALSLKKAQKEKDKDLGSNINSNYFVNENNNLSLKKPKLKLDVAKNFLNNKFKPIVIENTFLNNNKNKYINNLTLKLNSIKNSSDINHIKKEELYIKSLSNNIKEKETNYIQNYNTKGKNYFFRNKPHLNDINIKNTKNKNRILLNDLFSLEHENNANKNFRLKTLNKKSISYYNNELDDINKNKLKKHQNNDLYNINPINSINIYSDLKGDNTAKLKNSMNINFFYNINDEKPKLTFKPIIKGKNLIHNLTEDFTNNNKRKESINSNKKNK